MGDPIEWGRINRIDHVLKKETDEAKENKRKKFKVFWMMRDASDGWKETSSLKAGYKKDGIVEEFPNPDKNTINLSVPKMRMPVDTKIFYWFNLGKTHVLYAENMGTPGSYGDRTKIDKTLNEVDKYVREKKHKEYILFYFERDPSGNEIWKKKQSKRIPKWEVESTDKQKITDVKKKEENTDKKTG